MITKLEQLTLSQFVDLACGDTSVLIGTHEIINPHKLTLTVRDIMLEYRAIADPRGSNSYFIHIEEWIKARIDMMVFMMCNNLIGLGEFENVREVLESYGLPVSKFGESRIEGTVQSRLAQARREVDEFEKENDETKDEIKEIRAKFDVQTADLMAHYKFQIDPETIKAALYANLVARYHREVKAQLAALRKNEDKVEFSV